MENVCLINMLICIDYEGIYQTGKSVDQTLDILLWGYYTESGYCIHCTFSELGSKKCNYTAFNMSERKKSVSAMLLIFYKHVHAVYTQKC